jgi:hypothetical protein
VDIEASASENREVYYDFNSSRGEPDHGWCYSLAHQHRFIPMAGSIKSILNAVVVIAVIVWLLNVFGLLSSLARIHVGK